MKFQAGLAGLGACAVLLAACGQSQTAAEPAPAEVAAPPDGVHMDADAQSRMGVVAQPIALSSAPQMAQGFARVMDVGPLAAIESEISTAMAAAASSQEEYRRLVALAAQDQAASARSVEAARAQAAADGARTSLAARRIGLEWGAGLGKLSDTARSRLLADIAAGKAAMLRIDAPSANTEITRATIQTETAGTQIEVTLMGPAAAADARLQTAGLLGVVRGDAAANLTAGRMLQANLELGAAATGFLLPEGALVRADGAVLVYVKSSADTFERRDVGSGRSVTGGWFVSDGFQAGDQVVTQGASSLLAAEAGPVEAE